MIISIYPGRVAMSCTKVVAYVAIVAGTLIAPSVDAANSMEMATGSIRTTNSAPVRPALRAEVQAASLVIGDRLKLAFYQQIQKDVAGAGGKSNRPLMTSLVEYSELAGEYVVQEDGQIFVPLLGSVNVVGQSPSELEQTLSQAFNEHMAGSVKVSIQLVEREPIYVTGKIAKPGTFKYVPGMTVLHALTLAAG